MKCDIVYNPVAGSYRPERLERLASALQAGGIDAQPMATTAEGARLSGEADLICVAGGDGTLRDTVQAMGEDAGEVPLALARMGTINLVARELDYAKDPAKLARQIAAAHKRGPESWVHSPLFRLGAIPVVSCLGIGPDSIAVASVSGAMKRRIGRFAYVAAMAKQLARWPRAAMEVSGELADGTPFATEAEAVILSRGALYAGPFRLSPKAGLASETVELITLRSSTRLRTLAFSTAAMVRLPVSRFGFAEIRSVRRASLGDSGLPMQVDGDHLPNCAQDIVPSGQVVRYCV